MRYYRVPSSYCVVGAFGVRSEQWYGIGLRLKSLRDKYFRIVFFFWSYTEQRNTKDRSKFLTTTNMSLIRLNLSFNT